MIMQLYLWTQTSIEVPEEALHKVSILLSSPLYVR